MHVVWYGLNPSATSLLYIRIVYETQVTRPCRPCIYVDRFHYRIARSEHAPEVLRCCPSLKLILIFAGNRIVLTALRSPNQSNGFSCPSRGYKCSEQCARNHCPLPRQRTRIDGRTCSNVPFHNVAATSAAPATEEAFLFVHMISTLCAHSIYLAQPESHLVSIPRYCVPPYSPWGEKTYSNMRISFPEICPQMAPAP